MLCEGPAVCCLGDAGLPVLRCTLPARRGGTGWPASRPPTKQAHARQPVAWTCCIGVVQYVATGQAHTPSDCALPEYDTKELWSLELERLNTVSLDAAQSDAVFSLEPEHLQRAGLTPLPQSMPLDGCAMLPLLAPQSQSSFSAKQRSWRMSSAPGSHLDHLRVGLGI